MKPGDKTIVSIKSENAEAELYRYSSHQMSDLPAPFKVYQVELDQTYPYHWLEFFEIGLVTHGEGKHIINGQTYALKPGTLFLLSPADFHSVIITAGQRVRLTDIVFTEQMIHEDLLALLFRERYFFNLDLENQQYSLFQSLFEQILQEFNWNQPGSRLLIASYLQNMLVLLARTVPDSHSPTTLPLSRSESQPDSLQRALIFIHHHFRQPIRLEDAASQAFLSPNYFSERFHAVLGISFQHYLQNLRLRFAEGLLKATDLPIFEILFAAGFNDPTHFGRVFKQTYLLSPREFRKKHRLIKE